MGRKFTVFSRQLTVEEKKERARITTEGAEGPQRARGLWWQDAVVEVLLPVADLKFGHYIS